MENELFGRRNKGTVVFIDDDSMMRKLLYSVLTKAGYTVFGAKDSAQLWGHLNIVEPTVILLDVNMQEMDGYTICQRIRTQFPDYKCPIIFVTGNKTPYDVREAMSIGGDYYIVKPFTPSKLIDGISKAFNAYKRKQLV